MSVAELLQGAGLTVMPVIQEETTGCGIAVVAAIAGISYVEARRVANRMGITAENPALWSDTDSVRRLLERFGYVTDESPTPFDGWTNLPDRALIALKWHIEKGKPFWHWAIFVRAEEATYVLDSKKTLKTQIRTDFGRMHPKWFLAVRPCRQRDKIHP